MALRLGVFDISCQERRVATSYLELVVLHDDPGFHYAVVSGRREVILCCWGLKGDKAVKEIGGRIDKVISIYPAIIFGQVEAGGEPPFPTWEFSMPG